MMGESSFMNYCAQSLAGRPSVGCVELKNGLLGGCVSVGLHGTELRFR